MSTDREEEELRRSRRTQARRVANTADQLDEDEEDFSDSDLDVDEDEGEGDVGNGAGAPRKAVSTPGGAAGAGGVPRASEQFVRLGVARPFGELLHSQGIIDPTEVQSLVIPRLLQGKALE